MLAKDIDLLDIAILTALVGIEKGLPLKVVSGGPRRRDLWTLGEAGPIAQDQIRQGFESAHVRATTHGWWFSEKSRPQHGCLESNANAIISLKPPYDPVNGNYQVRAVLCQAGAL